MSEGEGAERRGGLLIFFDAAGGAGGPGRTASSALAPCRAHWSYGKTTAICRKPPGKLFPAQLSHFQIWIK